MKSSSIGGQAVIEGIMMRNRNEYAVAVRKADGTIALEKSEYKSIVSGKKIAYFPIIRGVFAFIDSMILGTKTLTFSSKFLEDDPESADDKESGLMTTLVMIGSLIIAMGLFMLLPLVIANIFKAHVSKGMLALLEGLIRISLFILYILAISRMKDIRRTFMYHGAEHKCINCIEHGMDLTVENVRKSSKQHKRCGTSFLFFVMIISVLFFMFIRFDVIWMRMVSRIVMIPVIAGVSFEAIRLAGSSDSWFVKVLSQPGMWMQNLTTLEPDESMIEVAIQAVEAVFDWKDYQKVNVPKEGEE